jgi:hypothetical protein
MKISALLAVALVTPAVFLPAQSGSEEIKGGMKMQERRAQRRRTRPPRVAGSLIDSPRNPREKPFNHGKPLC